jgi:hypothetical protein
MSSRLGLIGEQVPSERINSSYSFTAFGSFWLAVNCSVQSLTEFCLGDKFFNNKPSCTEKKKSMRTVDLPPIRPTC